MKMRSFEDATAAIRALNSVVGLRRYAVPKNRGKYLLVWLYNVSFSLACFASMVVACTDSLQNTRYSLIRTVSAFFTFVVTVIYIGVVGFGWYHSKEMLAVKKKITIVDEKLKSLGIAIDYRPLFCRELITLLFLGLNVIVTAVTYCIWNMKSGRGIIILEMVYTLVQNIGVFPLSEFILCVCWLRMRFDQANDFFVKSIVDDRRIASRGVNKIGGFEVNLHQLSGNLNQWLSNRQKILPESQSAKADLSSRKVHALQEIRFVHLQLCSIAKMVNSIFIMQLMLYVSVIVIEVIIVLYALYIEVFKSNIVFLASNINAIFMLNAVDSLYNLAKIFLISFVCERTMKEAIKIIEIIHTYSVHDFDPETRDEILQFSLQISFNQIRSAGDNFFQLNYGFVRGCISFVTTYVIVMIQWSETTDPNDPIFHSDNKTIDF